MENKEFINAILEDFQAKRIKPFFDLEQYETDFEISTFFKTLRIGYISKQTTNDPNSLFILILIKKALNCGAEHTQQNFFRKAHLLKIHIIIILPLKKFMNVFL